ncbi:HD-GYP domain-containing protein [Shumkonia mesophila]|uniref:HD-GYP domain-containing protein n=1 Tax=Shumkonia mesophila TaxID=2838854 RepID=UPI0029349964|nr:HD-GYP domain-containing protein [Shumkonia mesophila]
MLGLVRQINNLLIAGGQESELLPQICQAIVHEAGFEFAWVGYRDGIDDCRVVVMGQAGHPVPPVRHTLAASEGAAERALSTGKTALGPSNGKMAGGQLALPFSLDDGASGILVIGFAAHASPAPDTISLLEGLAALAARSIANRKAEMELHHAQRISGVFLRKFETSLLAAVQAMAAALEKRDPYTAGHQRRVAALSIAIGREIGLSRHRLQGLHIGSLIHDIGKIQVPVEILAKPGRLRPEEMNLIRIHPAAGQEMVQGIDFSWPIGSMIVQHHERLDGSGYPNGLAGDDIILEARIIAVADVVEAIAAHRPYRPALGVAAALEEIRAGRGRGYDAAVVDACCALFARLGAKLLFGEEPASRLSVHDSASGPHRGSWGTE